MSFPEWAGYYFSLRVFFSFTKKELFMNYEDFKSIFDGNQFSYYILDFLKDSTTIFNIAIFQLKKKSKKPAR
jgi:hypothetical protein